ncbi:DUF433 domain-containing protein [Kocuria rosea]|uniref:DUF433 domain-containing protein n=1 Tax=Kocuria rosea TaxID=1275 RepID=UPI002011D14A|nr:DUF433 domain-containing protein [Kocuria rosea]
MAELDLTEHPSQYQLVHYSDSIALVETDGEAIDLVSKKHQGIITNLDDVFRPFSNFRGDHVTDFRHPSAFLEVKERRLGGWPTIASTRVPYDLIANLVEQGVSPGQIHEIYPTVTAAAAEDAGRFQAELKSGRPLQAVA